MSARLATDAIVVLHAAFIIFVLAGGLLVLWRPRVAWLHLPTVFWAAFVEFTGTICPLTPLENTLRRAAAQAGYAGDFVEHYLLAAIYPAGLTPAIQVVLGIVVIAVNVAVYAMAYQRRRRDVALSGASTPKRSGRDWSTITASHDELDKEIRR